MQRSTGATRGNEGYIAFPEFKSPLRHHMTRANALFIAVFGVCEVRLGVDCRRLSARRADCSLEIEDTGVLVEVERGTTTINDMGLLDFWKCHICEHAHYLMLLVPCELRQNETMSPRRGFAAVKNRLHVGFR